MKKQIKRDPRSRELCSWGEFGRLLCDSTVILTAIAFLVTPIVILCILGNAVHGTYIKNNPPTHIESSCEVHNAK